MKIEKFPVIAPDGTEYRVTITFDGYAYVNIDAPTGNRWFNRFRPVFTHQYAPGDGFDRDNPDYITLVNRVFADWEISRAQYHEHERKMAERRRKKASALEAFRQWNGKINEANQSEPEVTE